MMEFLKNVGACLAIGLFGGIGFHIAEYLVAIGAQQLLYAYMMMVLS